MNVVICESAENHPDGTYSIKRGGLDRFAGDLPLAINVQLFIEASKVEFPGRTDEVTITLSGVIEGQVVAGAVASKDADVARFVLPLQLKVERYGTLTFDVAIVKTKARGTAHGDRTLAFPRYDSVEAPEVTLAETHVEPAAHVA